MIKNKDEINDSRKQNMKYRGLKVGVKVKKETKFYIYIIYI